MASGLDAPCGYCWRRVQQAAGQAGAALRPGRSPARLAAHASAARQGPPALEAAHGFAEVAHDCVAYTTAQHTAHRAYVLASVWSCVSRMLCMQLSRAGVHEDIDDGAVLRARTLLEPRSCCSPSCCAADSPMPVFNGARTSTSPKLPMQSVPVLALRAL